MSKLGVLGVFGTPPSRLRRLGDVKLLIFYDMSTKILLFSRPQIAHTQGDIERIFSLIEHYGFDFAINQEFASVVEQLTARKIQCEKIYAFETGEQPSKSVMLCFGGDGTLLEGIHRLSNKAIPVAGINLGHLGFLTSATRDNIETLFSNIADDKLAIQPRTIISVEGVKGAEATDRQLLALNEVSIQRLEASMLKVEAKVDSQTVAQYNGDGLIVATPTGSTAYSLSAGGPIVAPECECFLLTPLAPHNFGMRPVVIPDTAEIVLSVHSRHGEAMLSIDNRTYRLKDGEKITLRKCEVKILLVQTHNISFYQTLHSKMMWDVDIRN